MNPVGFKDGERVGSVSWAAIQPSDVEPEFVAAWREHVRSQGVRVSKAPSVTRDDLIARGVVTPCRTVAHLPSECWDRAAELIFRARCLGVLKDVV